MEHLLEVEKLSVSFLVRKEWVSAIDDVSFFIGKGETLGIVGESGCGKSVTSMSILQLLPRNISRIDCGSIVFKDKDIVGYTGKQMTHLRGEEIAMIFQDSMTSLNPVMKNGLQLEEALLLHRKLGKAEAREKVLEILKSVGIPSPEKRYHEYPHQLSGGMRQRLMIAMALIQSPSLLIADEPTTALDVTIQAQILQLMKDLKKTKKDISIMLITHDMGVVAEMTDRILVMYAGNIMEVGSTNAIFKSPKHPYTQGLLSSIPRPDKNMEALSSIEGNVPTLSNMPSGCRFNTRCKAAKKCCFEEKPPMFDLEDRQVRCWKYDPQGRYL
ncbi:ABC transporter ATP-binding protein [uncultured Sphaerochaeta sp.]|uniref:ABC transporter ATP-binding protein n=1 Tax=uncultured Sphaerochaeta sp. TaxID=886478 RepID=UPI002A0A553A|nr:ABC transporter ATP-binding protein [uncultured Sphaerochaeta sp.]